MCELTDRLVRKDRKGHAINSRVAARWRVFSVNVFAVTTMISTWKFETMISGPANCMVPISGALVFSGDEESARSQHVEDSDPEKDDDCFGGSIMQIANAAA